MLKLGLVCCVMAGLGVVEAATADAGVVPTVTVPPVPTVQVPSLPAVPKPPVPVPSLPAPAVPVPNVQTGSGGSGVSGGQSPSRPAGGPAAPRPAAPRPGGSSPAAVRTHRAAAPVRPLGPARRNDVRRGAIGIASPSEVRPNAGPREASAVRRERRLRRVVERLAGCLASLPRAERRVLALRAGAGAQRPQSRAAVARRLHVGEPRVRHLERAGLRRLRKAARDGLCQAGGAGAGAGAGAAATGGVAPVNGGGSSSVVGQPGTRQPAGAVGGSTDTASAAGSSGSAADQSEVKSARAASPALAGPGSPARPGILTSSDKGRAWLIPLLLLISGLLLGPVAGEVRAGRRIADDAP